MSVCFFLFIINSSQVLQYKIILLFETLIEKHSNENDVVMDTFLGGGTTAIASLNTKRKFKGCEISKEYCDIIEKRFLKNQTNPLF